MMENYDYLEPLHKSLIDVLSNFDILCNRLGINYFLVSGTLLGAFRHKGFIPWDDDIDIGVTRSDYNKLINYFKHSGNQSFELYCSDLSKDCHLLFSKFVDKSQKRENLRKYFEKCDNLSIDIFPYDACGNPYRIKTFVRFYHIKYLKFIIQSKKKIHDKSYVEPFFKRIARIILSSPLIWKKYDCLLSHVAYLEMKSDLGNGYWICLSGKNRIYGKDIISDEDLFPLFHKKFEGKDFPVPRNSIKFLETMYGSSWNRIPPENKREQHSHEI